MKEEIDAQHRIKVVSAEFLSSASASACAPAAVIMLSEDTSEGHRVRSTALGRTGAILRSRRKRG